MTHKTFPSPSAPDDLWGGYDSYEEQLAASLKPCPFCGSQAQLDYGLLSLLPEAVEFIGEGEDASAMTPLAASTELAEPKVVNALSVYCTTEDCIRPGGSQIVEIPDEEDPDCDYYLVAEELVNRWNSRVKGH